MTHELKKIISAYQNAKTNGIASVLATVVSLDGSSYRRPGVRMLIHENGKMAGAVSGGCVEKEVLRQADSVFKTSIPKIMTYDGRYRLGCEGILYILLELFEPDDLFVSKFWEAIESRIPLRIESTYQKEHLEGFQFGSYFIFNSEKHVVRKGFDAQKSDLTFVQELNPCFKLIIIGAEHDAVQLCSYAAMTGWEVSIVANPKEEKSIQDFPGATHFINVEAESFNADVDMQTAVVLMTHSFVKDLQFLDKLKHVNPAYLGVLGPLKRREKLLSDLLERDISISEAFIDSIHGPAGLDIGAETPQEIAIAVIAEILAVIHKRTPIHLKEREGRIHI
ncbi:XdhC/CoxI family protein [Croceitalea sp. MTPC9]|uniref:XdhC family protein n=1 Tax=unclassified Croceitalea TaxID=2632280 RepID=UPI002B3B05FB|nr:XdhC/CoxI family protein [Croceitalea sp. MTPC6]GMN15725.1 XdhC/CoxI family protein [Croceitalea sp. MTPC9]